MAFKESNVSFNISRNTTSQTDEVSLEIVLWFRITIGILQTLTFLLGTLSNIYLITSTCYKRQRIRSIHLYTLNLAVSDLLVLMIYLPMTAYQLYNIMRWEMGVFACRISYWTIASTVNANICTLIAVTHDRYNAVANPLTCRSRGLTRVKIGLGFIWLFSLLMALPLFMFVNVESRFCYEIWPNVTQERVYWFSLFLLQLLLPSIYFTAAYSLIAYHLRVENIPDDSPRYVIDTKILTSSQMGAKRRRTPEIDVTLNPISLKRKRQQDRLIKLAVLLVSAHIICVLPQHMVFFAETFSNFFGKKKYAVYVFVISNFLMTFNSLLNPILFITQGSNFRQLVNKLFSSGGGICKLLKPVRYIFTRKEVTTKRRAESMSRLMMIHCDKGYDKGYKL